MRDFLELPVGYRRALRRRVTNWLTGSNPLTGDADEDADTIEYGNRDRQILAALLHDRAADYAERVAVEAGFGHGGIDLELAAALWRHLADKTCRCY